MGIFKNRFKLEAIAFEQGYSVSAMSQIMGINARQFRYIFEKEFGISPKVWLIDCRVKKAINLLEQGLTPNEIWKTLHYSNLGHMRNEVKASSGLSPREIQLSSSLNRIRLQKM